MSRRTPSTEQEDTAVAMADHCQTTWLVVSHKTCLLFDLRPSNGGYVIGSKKVDLSQVQIETLGDDGRWHLHTDFQPYQGISRSPRVSHAIQLGVASPPQPIQAPTAHQHSPGPIISRPVFRDLDFDGHAWADSIPLSSGFHNTSINTAFSQGSMESVWNLNDDNASPLGPAHFLAAVGPSGSRSLDEIEAPPVIHTGHDNLDIAMLETQAQDPEQVGFNLELLQLGWHSQWLRNLPFGRFEIGLKQQKGRQNFNVFDFMSCILVNLFVCSNYP